MRFSAIDVETANADMASICQIGIATFENGNLIDTWSTLVDPEDDFDWVNIDIHGITEEHVRGQPTFPELASEINRILGGNVAVCHTHFDRVSTQRAADKYGLPHIQTNWLDSARVARRAWDECADRGYGLTNVCKLIGYEFRHHDALEDAKAAGQVMLAAIDKTGMTIEEWLHRVNKPIHASANSGSGYASAKIARDGDPEGPMFGEVLVFTGSLTMPRSHAADLAAKLGCKVGSSVTKKTTLLVVGDQDVSRLAGKMKSSKHLKAEDLNNQGQRIRILRESDFAVMIDHL